MRLYYFTNSFPYGLGEEWKSQELNILVNRFDDITVIPHSYGGNPNNPVRLNKKITVAEPLFEAETTHYKLSDFLYYLIAFPGAVLSEIIDRRVFVSRARFIKLMQYLSNVRKIAQHPEIKKMLADSDSNTFWFFYWGRGTADVIPFLPSFVRKKIGVRLHRFDVFEFANSGYIPFRKIFYRTVDACFSVSEYGRQYLKNLYPEIDCKVRVARLGTKSRGLSQPGRGEYFQLVSCSTLAPVKRVELIVEALIRIGKHKIEWTHIGAGPLQEKISNQTALLPKNIKVNLTGKIHPSNVLDIYVRNRYDLFINVSESEGIPVSIMEALSASIPVMATNAGGTGEIVDNSVGCILPVEVSPDELAHCISNYIELPEDNIKIIRRNAFSRYQELCDIEKCTSDFLEMFCE
jgi:colanic acid/amylovoran biosynthesis glycosyltransferase